MKKILKTMIPPNNIFDYYNIIINNTPTSFNGFVRFKKYKITIEEINESKEILCKRLEKLWCEEKNYHQYKPLQEEAKKLKYKFKNSFGSKIKKDY